MSATAIAAPARTSSFINYMVIVGALKVMQLSAESLRTYDGVLLSSSTELLVWKLDELSRMLPTLPVYALTLLALEWLPFAGAQRLVCAIALILACALVSTGLSTFLFPYGPVSIRVSASASVAAWFWYTLWANIVIGALAVLAADRLRERRRAVEHLAGAHEVSRVIRQRLARTRLMAIQARVDPQLVFDMLAAVKVFYVHDAARAEQLLDELTIFLRAALPRLRSERSTLEIEFGLVTAYAQLLRIAFDAPISVQTSLPTEAPDAVVPAGLLLPLVTQLLNGRGAETQLDIDARLTENRIHLRVCCLTLPDDGSIERARASLADLYGERASLQVSPASGTVEIDLPREHE